MGKEVLRTGKQFHPLRFFEIFLYRINNSIARRHIERYPQLAIFAFDHIGLTINLEGRFEGEDLDILRQFLTEILAIRTEAAALDIGANIGNHALFFDEIFSQVLAFEPNPRTFKLLEFNCHDSSVTPFNIGVSSVDATLDFLVLPSNIGGSCIVPEDAPGKRDHLMKVEVCQLDRFAALDGLDIALIKIDVEGHELEVLRGAQETLARTRPVIVFEQLKREIRDGTSELIAYLGAHDYSFFTIQQNHDFAKGRLTRALAFALRSVFGFQKSVVQTTEFEAKNHDMIIAVPSERL